MHIILGVSPVSVGPCMCAVRTQVTEDRPLKKCNCTTSTAQDQPSAGQGNIELSLKRGRGCAACTAHRESYGGAGPGVAQPVLRVPVAWGQWLPRIQCREEQRSIRSGERRRVQYILYRVMQVNRGRGKFGKGDGQSTTFLRLVFKST